MKDIIGIYGNVLKLLRQHDFPGNIRALENIIEYGFILCPGGYIQQEHLPESILSPDNHSVFAANILESMTLEQIEQQAILYSLKRNKWKRMMTCRELGISKDTQRRKIERYNLQNPIDT